MFAERLISLRLSLADAEQLISLIHVSESFAESLKPTIGNLVVLMVLCFEKYPLKAIAG